MGMVLISDVPPDLSITRLAVWGSRPKGRFHLSHLDHNNHRQQCCQDHEHSDARVAYRLRTHAHRSPNTLREDPEAFV